MFPEVVISPVGQRKGKEVLTPLPFLCLSLASGNFDTR